MKKLIAVIYVLVSVQSSLCQILPDHSYPLSQGSIGLTKFQINGNKYVQFDNQNKIIRIYNLNHSLFKSFSVPTVSGIYGSIAYLSDSLFNTDNLIEYMWLNIVSGSSQVYIFNELGTQLLMVDSAQFGTINAITSRDNFYDDKMIFSDGISTKMRLSVAYQSSQGRDQIYTLPGAIPCVICGTNGNVTTGLLNNKEEGTANLTFYPNPVKDQLKLKYTLPKNAKVATIRIQDVQGKLLDEFTVTNTFDFIYLPSSYNNGLYFYTLTVDGQTVKTEKIVLDK